jgi:nicotinate phosphoribosyltransferase
MSTSDLADEYFNRSYVTVRGTPLEHVRVCYAVFCRSAGRLAGVADVLDLVRQRGGPGVTVRGKSDGDEFEAMEVVLTLEGPFGRLVTLETESLGMLSLSGAATNMAAVVAAAREVSVIDMAARHFPPEIATRIGVAAAIGGAVGTSTRAGYAEAHARFGIGGERIRIGATPPRDFRLYGTIPHALNAVRGGSSVESAAAYHERHPNVPLVVLVDYEGQEKDTVTAAVQRFHSDLFAVRIDTPGNRVFQGGHEKPSRALEMRILSQATDRAAAMAALNRYGFGPGVTIEEVYAIRDLLDSLSSRHTKIVVSSGFDLGKVRAFKACNAPMDFIGTGSWVTFATFTSDIIRVLEDGTWRPQCKAGRAEELHEPPDLPVLLTT